MTSSSQNVNSEPIGAPGWQRAAWRLAHAPRFVNAVLAVIMLNGIVIGAETYPSVHRAIGDWMDVADRVFLAFFTFEIAVRLAAVGFRPARFVRDGWNVFDFVVVAGAYVPGLAANATALRLLRLLRVARLLRVMPDVRILLDGMRRAARPAAGLVALTLLLLYLYGVVGWSLFATSDPERWGTVGEAMLTLFTLLTLEGWNEILAGARAASPAGLVFILSFVLIGTFVVLNLVIGVVLTSLDEAHQHHRRSVEGRSLSQAIDDVRDALDTLERHLDAEALPRERVAVGAGVGGSDEGPAGERG